MRTTIFNFDIYSYCRFTHKNIDQWIYQWFFEKHRRMSSEHIPLNFQFNRNVKYLFASSFCFWWFFQSGDAWINIIHINICIVIWEWNDVRESELQPDICVCVHLCWVGGSEEKGCLLKTCYHLLSHHTKPHYTLQTTGKWCMDMMWCQQKVN